MLQVVIQSGQSPTVLQQMCSLPFQYFSDPRLTAILFPTLIACCYVNKSNTVILEQELSCALLSNFIEVRTGCVIEVCTGCVNGVRTGCVIGVCQ